MPQVSGKTLFNLLPDLWVILMRFYRLETGQLDVDCTADLLVAAVYASKYSAHVKASPSLQHVLLALRASKLSDRATRSPTSRACSTPSATSTGSSGTGATSRSSRTPSRTSVRRRGVVEYSH